jgi:hypothetical protein
MLLHDADDADHEIRNPGDRQKVNEQVLRLNKMAALPEALPLLAPVQ